MALLPLLYVHPQETTVAVVGPIAPLLAGEALKWRSTVAVIAPGPLGIKDKRINIIPRFDPGSCDAVLMSPDMIPQEASPAPELVLALKPNGVLSMATTDGTKLPVLLSLMHGYMGNATPWREYTPEPLWGVIGCKGRAPTRKRTPPGGAKRISKQYLPNLFIFGRDELPLVLPQNKGKLTTTSS